MPDAPFQYERFFELSPDLLCIAGFDGYFKKINAAVPKLLGYSLKELYARPINDFVYAEDKEKTAQVRQELTKAKPLRNFENRYVTKSGEIVWLSWTSQPIESEQLIFAIAKNITHKKRQEAERNALLAELTRINKELKQFNYTASHDLRSPVNNLLAIFSVMDLSKINDAKTVRFLNVLKMAGQQLKQSMDNYVDLLREKNKLHANVEEISLEENLKEVLQAISALIQASKASININFSELRTVRFNKVYLQSILLNLLTNAMQYARPDKLPEITIYSESRNGVKRLIFSDNGQGFDMETVGNRIFGLHQKFHDNPDAKGIGLYLVHNHVTNLGGQISVESKPNHGTTFRITFAPDY